VQHFTPLAAINDYGPCGWDRHRGSFCHGFARTHMPSANQITAFVDFSIAFLSTDLPRLYTKFYVKGDPGSLFDWIRATYSHVLCNVPTHRVLGALCIKHRASD
jgi:hypothetical protein